MRKILSIIAIFLLMASCDIIFIPGKVNNSTFPGVSGKGVVSGKKYDIAAKVGLLAPPADVLLNSGQIDNTLIADSVKRTGRSSSYLFDHEAQRSAAPETTTITLFLKGTTILFGFNKRI